MVPTRNKLQAATPEGFCKSPSKHRCLSQGKPSLQRVGVIYILSHIVITPRMPFLDGSVPHFDLDLDQENGCASGRPVLEGMASLSPRSQNKRKGQGLTFLFLCREMCKESRKMIHPLPQDGRFQRKRSDWVVAGVLPKVQTASTVIRGRMNFNR